MSIIETRFGSVEGVKANGLHTFLGIPFAAPPVGNRRWMPPTNPEPWAGVRSCKEFSRQAWQPVLEDMGPLAFAFNSSTANLRDEDCLYLNVWTPGLDNHKRPVLVWIHGGAFSNGTGCTPMYEGVRLAQRGDAVVVTINYRLAALGFMNLNEVTNGRIPATGNEGLLDQVMALEWVRDNIEWFGGDPSRVTIFGESAGGMSVGSLMAFRPAKSLFHRAIPQSGACSTAQTITQATEVAQAVLDQVGVSASAPLEKFLALDPEKLMQAGTAAGIQLGGTMIFQPCIDGTTLTDLPINEVRRGASDGVPVLVGVTRDEWRLFTAMPGFTEAFNDKGLMQALSINVEEPNTLVEAYREARGARGEAVDPTSLYAAIETDRTMRIPAIDLAEAISARGGSAYQYIFTWESPWGDGCLGSPHGIDIGYVFDTREYTKGSSEFFGKGPTADKLTELVQDVWLKFASEGNPVTDPLGAWQAYDTDQRSTVLFDANSSVSNDPYGTERAVWTEVRARVGYP